MVRLQYFIIVVQLLSSGCKTEAQRTGYIVLEAKKDSCYWIIDSTHQKAIEVSRTIEIVENTLEDTIGLGFAIVHPNQTGKFKYLRSNESPQSGVIYYETPDEQLPKTKTFCIDLYQRRSVKGYLKIKYYY